MAEFNAGTSPLQIDAPTVVILSPLADPVTLDTVLTRLPRHLSKSEIDAWRDLAARGQFEALAEALMVAHYDPAYHRSSRKDQRTRLGMLELADLGPAGLATAAGGVAALLPSP